MPDKPLVRSPFAGPASMGGNFGPSNPAPGSGTGTTKPQPAGGSSGFRGYPSMFEPSHYVNGVRTNRSPV